MIIKKIKPENVGMAILLLILVIVLLSFVVGLLFIVFACFANSIEWGVFSIILIGAFLWFAFNWEKA